MQTKNILPLTSRIGVPRYKQRFLLRKSATWKERKACYFMLLEGAGRDRRKYVGNKWRAMISWPSSPKLSTLGGPVRQTKGKAKSRGHFGTLGGYASWDNIFLTQVSRSRFKWVTCLAQEKAQANVPFLFASCKAQKTSHGPNNPRCRLMQSRGQHACHEDHGYQWWGEPLPKSVG